MDEQDHTVSLEYVLRKLSAHLDALAGQVFEVEHALGDVLKSPTNRENLSITKFQTLDFARQSLEDCALLLHTLGDSTQPISIEINPAFLGAKLKLDTTRSLILEKPLVQSVSNKPAGEMDLF